MEISFIESNSKQLDRLCISLTILYNGFSFVSQRAIKQNKTLNVYYLLISFVVLSQFYYFFLIVIDIDIEIVNYLNTTKQNKRQQKSLYNRGSKLYLMVLLKN